MKLVWCPETASKAYISTVKSCVNYHDSGVAELLAAMAAGWRAKLIVETWSNGDPIAISVGLSVASDFTGGRHVCIVPDERSRSEYLRAMGCRYATAAEVVVAEKVVAELEEVDFLVVDSKRRDFVTVLRSAKLSSNGAVLVRKNVFTDRESSGLFSWSRELERGTRVVRAVILPVGKGLDIAYIGSRGSSGGGSKGNRSRWMEYVDHKSGEVHVFRG